ncbi:MAG: T9SS type A sorting domain-containing protein [Fluviicola sp.]|nr:T9SS type A sorting domain-containing protein [Fluviicola sp.]
MKKSVIAACLFLGLQSFAQTVIFGDNFEMPGFNWTLNSSVSGNNQWTMNATYTGSAANFIPNVPNQPVSFLNGPQSTYLHVYNLPNCNGFVPVTCNANYDVNSVSDCTTEMSFDLNTSNDGNVTLTFWYLSGGDQNGSYGTVEYSTDGGSSWTATGSPLYGVTNWTEISFSNPAFDAQASLRFRFRWQNNATGINPPFSIDELTVTSEHLTSNETITMQHLNANIYCPGDDETIGFEALGTYNAGNIFIAQLSDATGSFASPVNIGTLASTASGIQSISATYPVSTPAGTAYRVRVIASDPSVIGGDNGEDVIFNALPVIDVTTTPQDGVICLGTSATLTAGGATTYMWSPSATLSADNGTAVTATPAVTTIYTITGTQFEGCTNTGTVTVTVEDCAALGEQDVVVFELYPNPATDLVTIKTTGDLAIESIELLNNNGQVIRTISGITSTISASDLAAGSYFMRIQHANGVSNARFIKE